MRITIDLAIFVTLASTVKLQLLWKEIRQSATNKKILSSLFSALCHVANKCVNEFQNYGHKRVINNENKTQREFKRPIQKFFSKTVKLQGVHNTTNFGAAEIDIIYIYLIL